MITCPGCGRSVDDHQAAACPACGAALIIEVAADPPPANDDAASPPPPGAAPPGAAPPGDSGSGEPPPPVGSSIPFEDRSLPLLTRLIETMKLAFVDPVRLFSSVPDDRDILPAVLYGVIIGTIGAVFSSMWQLLIGGLFDGFDIFAQQDVFPQTGFAVLTMIFSPVFAVVGLFIGAGIFHVSLYVLGDGKRGFAVTLRVLAYGSTPALLGVVPFCGGLIGYLWSIVLAVVGASQAHGTEWWRALLAYLIFPFLCCCVLFGMAMMAGLVGGLAQ